MTRSSLLALLVQLVSSQTYLPIAYTVDQRQEECLYERIAEAGENLTSSVFVLSGDELRAAIVIEGPVAPVDINLDADNEFGGVELAKFLDRYSKEGVKMFVDGKYGDSMMNVFPLKFTQMLDYESDIEEFDDASTTKDEVPPDNSEQWKRRVLEGNENDTEDPSPREEQLKKQVRNEFEYDDDFVKLQTEGRKKKDDADGGGQRDLQHRRLQEATISAGKPYQKTFQIRSPGWYRLCIHAKVSTLEVEMELRKSSTYGKVNPKTGHVPSLQDLEIHSEIRHLFEKEDDTTVLAEEESIKDEDFRTTHEQLRVLEKVYQDLINTQLEERRVWTWRTLHNKHLYSHMVMGNMVETVFYICITGWQVYTIRKWFGGGPTLGK